MPYVKLMFFAGFVKNIRGMMEQSASEKGKRDVRKVPSFSGPLMLPNRASANSLSAPIRSSGGIKISRFMEEQYITCYYVFIVVATTRLKLISTIIYQ